LDERGHQADNARTVRAAVDKISDKYEMPTIWVLTLQVITKVLKQIPQRTELAMYVAHDIKWTIWQGLKEGTHRRKL
jgi:hypothetical protein